MKTSHSVLACAALLLWVSAAQSQPTASGTVSGASAASAAGTSSSMSSHKATKKDRKSGMKDTATNQDGASTPNSTGATPGIYSQSGAAAPTTPDPMQIKNARDGSPMKTSTSTAASGAKKP